MNKAINFLIFWILLALLLLVVSAIFAKDIVLGNANMTRPMAAVFVGLLLAALFYLVPSFLVKVGLRKNLTSTLDIGGLKLKGESAWFVVFFVINTIAIWVIKRFANATGLGVSNIPFVLILAVLVTAVEKIVSRSADEWVKKILGFAKTT